MQVFNRSIYGYNRELTLDILIPTDQQSIEFIFYRFETGQVVAAFYLSYTGAKFGCVSAATYSYIEEVANVPELAYQDKSYFNSPLFRTERFDVFDFSASVFNWGRFIGAVGSLVQDDIFECVTLALETCGECRLFNLCVLGQDGYEVESAEGSDKFTRITQNFTGKLDNGGYVGLRIVAVGTVQEFEQSIEKQCDQALHDFNTLVRNLQCQ